MTMIVTEINNNFTVIFKIALIFFYNCLIIIWDRYSENEPLTETKNGKKKTQFFLSFSHLISAWSSVSHHHLINITSVTPLNWNKTKWRRHFQFIIFCIKESKCKHEKKHKILLFIFFFERANQKNELAKMKKQKKGSKNM